jgi:hypothetical protein
MVRSANPVRRAAKCATVIALVALAALVIVSQLGTLWHLLHGRQVELAGVTFTLPRAYLARWTSKGNLTMYRLDFGRPVWPAPYGGIGVYPRLGDRHPDWTHNFEYLASAVIAAQRPDGMQFVGERNLDTAAGRAYCFRFRSTRSSRVVCSFENYAHLVLFDGSEKYVSDAYELTGSARPAR